MTSHSPFLVGITNNGIRVYCRDVIVATGLSNNYLVLECYDNKRGTYCAMNLVMFTWVAVSPFPDSCRFQLAFILRGPTMWAMTSVGLGSVMR